MVYKVEKDPKIQKEIKSMPIKKVLEGLVCPIESPIMKPYVSDETIERALVLNKLCFFSYPIEFCTFASNWSCVACSFYK